MVTQEQLQTIMPLARSSDIAAILEPFNATLIRFEIDNPKRVAAFIGQIAHETMSLRYKEEIASGVAYEWRKDLGNTQAGDGMKFKGRGLLQITGRFNYEHCSRETGLDIVNQPWLAAAPKGACLVSGWFWHGHNLNPRADTSDILFISKVVNGGKTGLQERLDFTRIALKVLENA